MSNTSKESFINNKIVQYMDEGVLTLSLKGEITTINPAAEKILELRREDIISKKYIEIFFEHEENDSFNQIILNAIYESSTSHNSTVNYYNGSTNKSLFITTSFLQTEEEGKKEKIGVIAVFHDISELQELRDAVKAMEKIRELNGQLEIRNKFISEAFGRFVSDDFVAEILKSPESLKLGGAKKTISLLMSDLRGFTSLSEGLPAESVVAIINNYLGKMVDIILQYNGTIIDFFGDSIFAIFGAPLSNPDHAEMSLACAIQMQKSMKEVNEWNIANNFPDIEMGIGLNIGQIIVGNIGSEKRTKYSAVDRHVNLTARIESYTVGGQILISEETLKAIDLPVKINKNLEIMPKGVNKPITIYDISGLGEPYNLFLNVDKFELVEIDTSIPIKVSWLENKHCIGKIFNANICELSLKEAVILCDIDLPAMTSLKIMITSSDGKVLVDDLYAMVTKQEETFHTLIRFTWVSQQAKDFIKSKMEKML